MRWSKDYTAHNDWHPWFAWRPIRIYIENSKNRFLRVWLETVERRCEYEYVKCANPPFGIHSWKYRLKRTETL